MRKWHNHCLVRWLADEGLLVEERVRSCVSSPRLAIYVGRSKVEFNVWDFAGQLEYLTTHQFFITVRTPSMDSRLLLAAHSRPDRTARKSCLCAASRPVAADRRAETTTSPLDRLASLVDA